MHVLRTRLYGARRTQVLLWPVTQALKAAWFVEGGGVSRLGEVGKDLVGGVRFTFKSPWAGHRCHVAEAGMRGLCDVIEKDDGEKANRSDLRECAPQAKNW